MFCNIAMTMTGEELRKAAQKATARVRAVQAGNGLPPEQRTVPDIANDLWGERKYQDAAVANAKFYVTAAQVSRHWRQWRRLRMVRTKAALVP